MRLAPSKPDAPVNAATVRPVLPKTARPKFPRQQKNHPEMKTSKYANSRQTAQGLPAGGATKRPAGMYEAMNTAIPVQRKLGKAKDVYPTRSQSTTRVA